MDEDEDYYDEDYDELPSEDILQIQEEYFKRRLRESLIGPVIVSTVFHVVLIIFSGFCN